MAKQSGLGDALYVAGYDLSGDIGSLSRIGGGPSPLDVTAIDKSAMERIGGRRDGSIEFSAWFNPSANQAHARLKTLPTADVILTYCRGTVLGGPAAAMVAKQVNYDGARGDDGSFTFAVQAQANGYGIEWGKQATAGKRTDGASGIFGAAVDFGVGSTAFGMQAYLQVFALTGTSVTVRFQGSSDDGAGDPYADIVGGAFSAATGPTAERIATSSVQTIERYLKVYTSGVFTNAVFAVTVVRNDSAVSF